MKFAIKLFSKTFGSVLVLPAIIISGVPQLRAQAAQPIRPARQETLLNGLRTAVFPQKVGTKVFLKLRVHAGAAFDRQDKEGTMSLLAGSFFPNPTAGEFFREDLGGHLEISTTYDYIQISASARADEFLTLVEAIGNAIANPSIDKQSVASLKQAQIEQIAAAERDPAFRGERAVLARLFGKFPYGRPIKGTRQSLANIDFADVIDAKKRFLVADNASVAISGPVDPSLAVRAVKRYFGAWSKADKSVPATFRQPDSPPSEVLVVEEDALPDFWVAFDGVPRGNAGFPAAEILGEILKFRLKANLTRDETSADVKNRSYLLRGAFAIGLPAGELEDAREFVRALIAKPIEQGEFESAKAKAVTAYLNLGADDIWLDSETYKSISLANAAAAISSVEIADLRSLQTRLAAEPFVAVRFSKKASPAAIR